MTKYGETVAMKKSANLALQQIIIETNSKVDFKKQ